MNEETLFERAVQLPTAERTAFLDRECAGQPELRERVEALLATDAASYSPLDHPIAMPELTGQYTPLPEKMHPTSRKGTKPHPDSQAGAVIAGKYILIEVIGEGGMGSVWRAKQTEPVKRFVAVKLIKAGMDSKQVLARFEAERQTLALMDHPNIAKVLDGGLHEQKPFFVMELVKGVPITDYCDANKLTPQQRLELFVQACQAIQHAHQKGIIHRDIKPSNVMIALYDDKPVVKVIDFGVAKATGGTLTEATIDTGFGGVVGTPQYMSPEQATFNNLDIDTRSDVYALGVLLYELLAGSPPFSVAELKKKGFIEILRVVREEEPPRPSAKVSTADTLPSLSVNRGTEPKKLTGLLRNELDWIVMKALEKDRTRRYETANGFAADVLRYLAGDPVMAHPPSMGYRFEKFVRRHKGQVIAASLILVALVAGVVGTTFGMVQARRANTELAHKNAQLAEEQAKVQARFELAQQAIATFHTGVSEDALLKNEQFQELRTKLLKEAAQFYGGLEKLLGGQGDWNSRRLLADGYFQLGGLTAAIGDQPAALAVHRKALGLRRELAGEPGANVESRLAVAQSFREVGLLMDAIGETSEAIRAWEEQRDISLALEPISPNGAALELAALANNSLGFLLGRTGKMSEAQASFEKALALFQKLTIADPTNNQLLAGLAQTYLNIGNTLRDIGRSIEALAANEKALDIRQKLAAENPSVIRYQTDLASSHTNVGFLLNRLGRSAEGLVSYKNSLAIRQKLADAQPAVNQLQSNLAESHYWIAILLGNIGQSESALDEYRKALSIQQRLAETNPNVTRFQASLGVTLSNLGGQLAKNGQSTEAIIAYQKAVAALQKLVDTNPAITNYQFDLAITESDTAHHFFEMGRIVEGLAIYHQSRDRLQKLVDANPTVPRFQSTLAKVQNSLGSLLARNGQPAEGLVACEKGRAIRRRLAETNREIPFYRTDLASSHNTIGKIQASQGRFAEAFDAFEAGLAIRRELVETHPAETMFRNQLGYCYAYRGWARVRTGQSKDAAADLRKAVELFTPDKNLELDMRFERVRSLALLARLVSNAKSGVTATEAKVSADQAITGLAEAIKAGWANLSELKESDFDALRDLADFKKMVAELEKKSHSKQEIPSPKEAKK